MIGVPDDDLGQRLHAVLHGEQAPADADLRAFLAERLAPHKIPRTIERVSGHVRGDDGKVRRSALVQRLATSAPRL